MHLLRSIALFVGGEDPFVATGTLDLNGSALLTLFPEFIGAGVLDLNGSSVLTTEIRLVGDGQLELNGAADLFRARFVRRLIKCGEPLSTFCQDWILGNNDPRRDG